MRRGVAKVAVATALAFSVAACAYNDHFDNRVDRYDVASERARDQMILTNIVRASKAEPLAFQSLGQISGSNTSSLQMGLPSLVIGPKAALSAATRALDQQSVFGANPGASGALANGVTTSGSTSFNVTPSETQDFYKGLLEPVEPQTLALFKEQGIADEILFYLFTEKVVEERAGAGHENIYLNDRLDPSFDAFHHYVELAMRYGLSAEPTPGAKIGAASSSDKSDKKNSGDSTSELVTDWRLCFNRKAWEPGTPYADNHPLCGSKEKMADPRTVTFRDPHGVKVTAHVFPRSTFSIFQYLGRLVAASDSGKIELITAEARGNPPLEDDTLFAVNAGDSGGCFLTVDYDGTYCVPNSALNTKRILGLLVQLLALNTSIRDVGITQQVQLLPQ
ncbi:MAG: hypothetical protein E7774_03180 [Bradyrhizobium sp.]|nr:MAG: hypothetical protein E7774_03180 [Bradyrhizobium sp.]